MESAQGHPFAAMACADSPFSVLDRTQQARLLQSCQRRRFKRGEVVFQAGDPGDALHLVVRGRFVVRSRSLTNSELVFAIVGSGFTFGELAVVGPLTERTATVAAMEPSETLEWRRAEVDRIRGESPMFDRLLVRLLAAQVHDLSNRLVELASTTVRTRVYRQLCALQGDAKDGGWIRIRQSDLAGLAVTSRPTVNQVLRAAVQDGLIELTRGRIRVLDSEVVRRRSF